MSLPLMVCIYQPRSSVVDIIQAVGRAIRKTDDKSCGYIILPVYLGKNESLEEQMESSSLGKSGRFFLL